MVKDIEHQDHVHGGISTINAAATFTTTGVPPPPSHGVDDFRPTAPGHSPGVGHSIHN